MALFDYRGRTSQGDLVTGRLEADSADSVASQLFNTGITPIDITPGGADSNALRQLALLLNAQRPRLDDILLFTRQMYSLTKAGVPLVRGLLGLRESTRNAILAKAINDVVESLEAGRDLATSLGRHPRIFNPLYISMVRVGENSGRLAESFDQLYKYMVVEKETRKQVTAALRYPIMVVVAIVIAVMILTVKVIPTFAQIFERVNLELPVYTRVILAVSDFMAEWWLVILVAAVAGVVGFQVWVKTDAGRYRWDKAKLGFPVAGGIILRATLARFSRAFSMAYRSGVPMIQTLTLCSRAVDNEFVGARVTDMRNGVERGESVSRTAAATGMFTPLVLQMISVGEETGALDDMLDETADFYEREVDYDVKNLASYIEPVLTVAIGAMVLILALGIFLPMWDLAKLAQR
ncbi:MAG: type II secretion system F family protein [Proteobacteria bacterium]|nr:type II secretion system F family protein [Pseudomonadota bacterium]